MIDYFKIYKEWLIDVIMPEDMVFVKEMEARLIDAQRRGVILIVYDVMNNDMLQIFTSLRHLLVERKKVVSGGNDSCSSNVNVSKK